ncbi:MAG TPA: efflux RND transporter periplasmic adaptor subunit [Cyclobacteriaceae bacterium]|jgi:RND family efflux transporter MFP subunit|nr:efflux RND transporter periplasmic adaptor subunit [Cyclobacteriaceae bacterium]
MNIQLSQRATLILIISALVFSCSYNKKDKEVSKDIPISVEVARPIQHHGEEISISGQIQSKETAIISTRVMGFVSSIKVKLGDRVQKGQLLISIDNGDILAKHAQAEAVISEVAAALTDAQKDYERFEELYKRQSASSKEFENATLHYNSIKAKAEAARQMKNETDAMLAYTNIVAPFSGVVTQKNVDEGSMANPGMPLITLEHPQSFNVNAFVLESDVSKLKNGMAADIQIKSSGDKMTGEISEISPSSQFTGGKFQIKIALLVPENVELFSGMHVHVNIPLKDDSRIHNLSVPSSAIIHKDQLSGIFTVNEIEKTAQLRWLRIGKKNGDVVEVLSGLGPQEKFITQSEGRLYNGASVLIK